MKAALKRIFKVNRSPRFQIQVILGLQACSAFSQVWVRQVRMLCSIASALPRGQDDFVKILTGPVLEEASSFKGEALEMQTENINNNNSST